MPASYREVDAKSVSRTSRGVDPWFIAQFGMNLYRGCEHGCHYCDGRAEKYRVEGDFSRDIVVKRNAPAVLARELARLREPGFVLLGGGVCDAYQPAEARFRLARQALELVVRHDLPVHVLTKSALIERDFDLLDLIQSKRRTILSFSIQTVDDRVREHFEPGAASIDERFRLLQDAKKRGYATGIMAMPVLPGISDRPDAIDALFARAADVGVDFVLCGGLTLRPGSQMEAFLSALERYDPSMLDGYRRLYRDGRRSGTGDARYYARLERRFQSARCQYQMPGRMPRHLFRGLIPLYSEVAVLLEHEAFARSCEGRPARHLEEACWSLQQWSRARLSKDRRLLAHELERELLSMLDDGSVRSLPNMTGDAVEVIRRIVAEIAR